MEAGTATPFMAAAPEIQVVFDDQPAVPAPAVPVPAPAVPDPTARHSQLEVALHRLELFLASLGFYQTASPLSIIISYSAFLLLGIATPIIYLYFSCCCGSSCHRYQIQRFELWVFIFEVVLAGVSLGGISTNLFKHGTRRLLFMDENPVERFQEKYARPIQGFFNMLLWSILPCFIAKATLEIIRSAYVHHDSMWKSVVFPLASIISWAYLSTIFLAACILFNLVCNLQVIRLEDYGKHLEGDEEALIYLEEHVRLRYDISKISHRFRIYLLLVFLFVTASQLVNLFQTTQNSEIVNFVNAGDLAISSVVQVVGVVLCLNAAAKISHRTQGIASVASKRHALVTCNTISDASLVSYHKRQALVLYLQTNLDGFTIYGWTLDRALLNTIFFIELTLVLFVI
ncbi:hypothetical protein J5N97_021864 [Dioscorea zingiberensis]|uniref:Uncharacterized protein n=1 Tax=Dioscorea zingiberensis TaxID=325984 RepID=A0A9D5HAA1_9LILI|nr:hypothetical protein J5N97_021864 [Dioscorea zingiberensis]